MATAVNDITGALITTKGKSTTNYADNYDRIFRGGAPEQKQETPVITLALKGGVHLVRLPDEIVHQLNWGLGDKLQLTIENDKLVLARR